MPSVVFVAPYPAEATMRFTRAAAAQEDVRLGLVSHQSLEETPAALRRALRGHWRVDDAFNADELEAAVRGVGRQLGSVDRLIGVLEQLQVPLAEVRDRLGIPGVGVEVARNFRDKARMKTMLRAAGLPCARHCLAASSDEARAFAAEVGFPLVVKPPAGAGAKATYRVDRSRRLEEILAFTRASAATPVLLEQYLTGRERSFETVMVDGEPVWHSISHYLPTPLEALENPWIQWCVMLPRDISGPEYDGIRDIGTRAVRELGLQTGLTHMEWFVLADGTLAISEVAARPPGAQITALTSLVHDFDLYGAWARLMIHGTFDPPERKFAAGAAFLRAQGEGRRVARIRGLEAAQRELGELVVEARLPQPGQPRSESYEGEGWVLLRHPETEVVEKGLMRLVTLLRVESEG
jgi:D-alanine-D-alanine ligase-like ATP-grasp enzyme